MFRSKFIGTVALATCMASPAAMAVDLSANIGFASEYIYRGIPQKTSSASGGLDLGAGGFYGGVWAADVGDGVEIDYYGGYGFEVGEFNFGVGGTLYTYTGDFDDTYKELNLSAGWRFLTVDYAVGEYDNFGGPKQDYDFISLTAEHNGFYGKVGTFGKDFGGTYYEAGYGSDITVNDKHILDYGIYAVYSDSTLLGGASDTNLVLTLGKTFDL